MPFSIRIGLERVGIARPKLELSLGRSADSGRWTPLRKQETKRIDGGSPVAAPMPKSVLSYRKKRSTTLESECSAYLSSVGWPGIYSICFSLLDGDKDSFSLDGDFLYLSLSY